MQNSELVYSRVLPSALLCRDSLLAVRKRKKHQKDVENEGPWALYSVSAFGLSLSPSWDFVLGFCEESKFPKSSLFCLR